MALSRHQKFWRDDAPSPPRFPPLEGGQSMIPNVLLKVDRGIIKSKQSFGQNLGGTDHIGVHPLQILGGRVPPRPPGFTPLCVIVHTFLLLIFRDWSDWLNSS